MMNNLPNSPLVYHCRNLASGQVLKYGRKRSFWVTNPKPSNTPSEEKTNLFRNAKVRLGVIIVLLYYLGSSWGFPDAAAERALKWP